MSDENSFTQQPLENPQPFQFDQIAFDDPDSFEDGSEEVEAVFPTHDAESRLKGNRVNELYSPWLANPCDGTLDPLLSDVTNFSRRVIQKKHPSADADDLAQEAVKKIWRELSRAEQRAENLAEFKMDLSGLFNTDWINEPPLKFSSWVGTVSINTLKEHWRKSYLKREVKLLTEKNYNATGGTRVMPGRSLVDIEESGEPSSSGRQALMTKEELERSETQLNDPIDRDLAIRKLSYQDQQLYWMVQDGYEDAELAEHFKTTKQKICNRWNYIRTLVDDALAVPAVIVHTCLPSFQNVYVMEEGLRYVEDESGKS